MPGRGAIGIDAPHIANSFHLLRGRPQAGRKWAMDDVSHIQELNRLGLETAARPG
jgi:hypothetical protein